MTSDPRKISPSEMLQDYATISVLQNCVTSHPCDDFCWARFKQYTYEGGSGHFSYISFRMDNICWDLHPRTLRKNKTSRRISSYWGRWKSFAKMISSLITKMLKKKLVNHWIEWVVWIFKLVVILSKNKLVFM